MSLKFHGISFYIYFPEGEGREELEEEEEGEKGGGVEIKARDFQIPGFPKSPNPTFS